MKNKVILGLLLGALGCLSLGFVVWRVMQPMRSGAQVVFLDDSSDSRQKGCEQLVARAEKAITSPEIGRGSTLTYFVTGGPETAQEPRLVARYDIPATTAVIEGTRATANQRQALLEQLKTQCFQTQQTKVSPIYQNVVTAVRYVQSVGGANSPRFVFVATDGEETSQTQIKRALNETPGTALSLPEKIANQNVRVVICGLSETIGQVTDQRGNPVHKAKMQDAQRAKRKLEVWQNMFTDPSNVTLEPFCVQGATPPVTSN